jgi:aconitate hydratase
MGSDKSSSISEFTLANGSKGLFYNISSVEKFSDCKIENLPYSIRVLLEGALRNSDDFLITNEDIKTIAEWKGDGERTEIPFMPSRVILQDFTGVPAVVDMAALRNAMVELNGNPDLVNPQVPVDLVIDHSVQVDYSGAFANAKELNLKIEYQRNMERYKFLKWGQKNLSKFRAIPPGRGIVHQVNLEWIATVAREEENVWLSDTLVGTDSHTTMINGLGVLGWGVGGIEAEAVMLGQPIYMLSPDVVGMKLIGALSPGVTATDMTLRIVELLRNHGVVGKFVEFFGEGMSALSLPDRATIANMAPEYGATCGFFPVDDVTLEYMRLSGRDSEHISNVESYCKAQSMWYDSSYPDPEYTTVLELDLSTIQPALAGPKRPQDRVNLSEMKSHFIETLSSPIGHSGHGLSLDKLNDKISVDSYELKHGDVVIAAITSCTNTSNPSVMIAAGLLAKKAREKGLSVKPWVKTSLAPGSRVVTEYYEKAGLSEYLSELGFNVVGYGCTTCIGNSGPLSESIDNAIVEKELIVGSVLSGNRNFEGRVHQNVKANYLASPPLVVAYALAGTLNIDLQNEPLGFRENDEPVFLKDIWPSEEELKETISLAITPEMFQEKYSDIMQEPLWDSIPAEKSSLYDWEEESTYIRLPTFFEGIKPQPDSLKPIKNARVLLKLGDSVTTDHISPAGAFPSKGPAGRYLVGNGVEFSDFNSFGSRRGNHEVMMRGTFANVRIRNHLAPNTEGGYTTYFPTDEVMDVYDASMKYQSEDIPLIVIAGSQYGTGSSRDWAAKGTLLLGVKAVISTSFERIHRSNLVGMGVLPLCFKSGEDAESLGLDGTEYFSIPINEDVKPLQMIDIVATKEDGKNIIFQAQVRLDTPVEVEYYMNGGILHTVLRNLAK